MIKVITTVGTSLLENTSKYFKGEKHDDSAKENYKEITKADKNGNIEKANRHANKLDEIVKEFFKKGEKLVDGEKEWEENRSENYINEDASAEIKSIIEIQKEVGEKIQVHLIASDTIASEKCAELIKYFFEEVYDKNKEKFSINFSTNDLNQSDKIKGLQIWDSKKYEDDGIFNLSNRIYQIWANSDEKKLINKIEQSNGEEKVKLIDDLKNLKYNCILNITGGYKGVIPYISTISQLMNMDIFYIFEDSSKLINIPNLEIQFDWNLAEKYYYYLSSLSVGEKIFDMSIINNLKNKKMIKNNNTLSGYGKFFQNFIENELPISRDNFGFAIEYKIYEYLIEKSYKEKNIQYKYIEHSNEDLNINGIKKYGGEIDLVLKKLNCKITEKENKFIACEIKSLFQIENKIDSVLSQTKTRLSYMLNPCDEYHFYIYTFNIKEYARNPKNIDKIVKELSKYTIKIFYIFAEIRDLTKNNPYQKFMQNKLDSKSIKEIKI